MHGVRELLTMAIKKPLVFDSTNQQLAQLADGDVLAVSSIPLAQDATNIIQRKDDGIYANIPDMVSPREENQLRADENGKLYVDPFSVSVSGAAGNALKEQADGWAVLPADLVSEAADNRLKTQDGRLYVAPVQPGSLVSDDEGNILGIGLDGKLLVTTNSLKFADCFTLISADAGNMAHKGSDDGVFVGASDILSNGGVNLLTVSPVDQRIELTEETLKKTMQLVSSDAGNILHPGEDGGVVLTMNDLISTAEGNRLVKSDKDEKLYVPTPVSADAGNAIAEGSDGAALFFGDCGTL